ncbi:tetratricopeptide repeat protein [Streptomyces sp. FXJ1.172]|uniref:tetratricopeptide repeat protein n=1 Tax=Streptomyces sp. FXJ1.172 TaxID=710705 RepID=UPI0007CF7557|nr:tetratricopeptide repeat protein [Streptomyces sp. FXJ1.172]WEO93622.1 tetratricopeptide repeat protein [Streptomyces sp. FXJ1.172]
MRLFRPRGRNNAGAPASPLARAIGLLKAGRYAEAEAEAREVASARSALRRDDPYAAQAWSIAAVTMGFQGRHAESLAVYDELLPVFGSGFGAEHWQTLKLRSDRAQTLIALDRHAEGEAECRAVARIADRGTGPQLPLIAVAARNGLVFALNAQGRHAEAETLARDVLARDTLNCDTLAGHPVEGRLTLVLRLGLARSLSGQGRHEEALAEAERIAALARDLPEEATRPETGAVELVVATAELGLGRAAEARARAAAAHDACRAVLGPDHRRTAEARSLLDRIDGHCPDTR